jgi:hypothetical protein
MAYLEEASSTGVLLSFGSDDEGSFLASCLDSFILVLLVPFVLVAFVVCSDRVFSFPVPRVLLCFLSC